jgi:hypothetical protein
MSRIMDWARSHNILPERKYQIQSKDAQRPMEPQAKAIRSKSVNYLSTASKALRSRSVSIGLNPRKTPSNQTESPEGAPSSKEAMSRQGFSWVEGHPSLSKTNDHPVAEATMMGSEDFLAGSPPDRIMAGVGLTPKQPVSDAEFLASFSLDRILEDVDKELLASFSPDRIMADADREFGQLPRSALEPTVATAGTTEQGHSTAPAGNPKPRALRRRHPPPEKSKSSPVLPEQRGIVTRNRPSTPPRTPEK